jgi:Condensation domain
MPTRPPLTRVDRDGSTPASFTQEERLLYGRGIQVPNTTVPLGLYLAGPLDTDALERSVGMLVQRHESLRLTFPESPAGRCITVTDGRDISLRRYSVETEAPERRTARALDLLAQAAAVPFDLARGPLFRAVLVRLSDTEHILGLMLEKILVDRNSCVILQRDLLALYDQALGRAGADLPELPLQFADYAAWERSYLQGAALDRLIAYWRSTLNGVDAIPDAGLTDSAAPQGQPPGLAMHTRTIPAQLHERLETMARAEGASVFAVLASALKAVMFARRRRAMDDGTAADVAVFGSIANRSHRAMKDVVGYLATYTVFRTDLSGDPTLTELVGRETRTVFGALCHQEVPHPLIAREVSPQQYGILHRFGQVDVPHFLHFDMDDDWATVLRPPGMLRVSPVRIPLVEVPRGWLRLIARNKPDGLMLQFRFRTDFYSVGWAEAFLADYTELLRMWPQRSDCRLSALR